MTVTRPQNIEMIPISRITVLNPRSGGALNDSMLRGIETRYGATDFALRN